MKRFGMILTGLFALTVFSGNVFAFVYSGSMTKGGYTYTDYFIARSVAGTYVGIFYNSGCYGTNHVTNTTHQFKPSCSTGGYVWYGTSCNVNMESCGYSTRLAVGRGYINSVFSDSGGGNYVLTSGVYNDWSTTKDIYSSGGSQSLILANTISFSLDVTLDPQSGGTVTSNPSGIDCPGTSCQSIFAVNSEVDLEASPDTGWAFAYWDNGTTNLYDNPLTVTMDSAKTLTAKFFKTFRCAAGNFNHTSGTGGWCTDYVNDETSINFSGDAYQWWQGAIDNSYATGSEPRTSAIVVLNNSSLEHGHVGIVTNYDATTVWIQDSNWCDPYCYLISNHTISRSRSDISGYIYCTP